jgi:hypothetical protein
MHDAGFGAAEFGAVAATLLNLIAEVASLAERVTALEGGGSGDAAAVQDLVRRVLAPLAAGHAPAHSERGDG